MAIADQTSGSGLLPGIRTRKRSRSAAHAPPHLDDLAHGGRSPRDTRVERTHRELEAAGVELLELDHLRVEAAALLVDEHDVAGADALGGLPARLGGAASALVGAMSISVGWAIARPR